MLKAEIQAEILALYFGDKKSARTISKELNVDRKSVAQVIQRRSVVFSPTARPKESILTPFVEQISELLNRYLETFLHLMVIKKKLFISE